MELRLTFNEDEYNYDQARPGYVQELYDDLFAYSNFNEASKAIEIGIGTGQATLPLLEKEFWVTAIEIGENLSAYVQHKYKDYSNFKVITGDFMEVGISDESVDLIYSATAFHWLPQPDAYKKVYDTLKPGGVIALFWNHPFPNREDDPSNLASKAVYDRHRPSNKPQVEFSEKDCNRIVAELKQAGFKDIQSKIYRRVRTLTTDQYLALLNTYSDHRALSPEIKNAFEKDMKESIDAVGGKINIYDTIDLYLARK